MPNDPELLNDFAAEIRSLYDEMQAIVTSLKANHDQSPLFEKFGQIIDRIYGTAATFGFAELAGYCGTLKKTCYDCAAANNKRAQMRVVSLLETCMQNLDTLVKGIHDPEATKKLAHMLHLESQKAKKLHDEVFQFTKKAA
jgi:chemotaxis protein histidine kinase CheA